jgi:prevent-host-death family protein
MKEIGAVEAKSKLGTLLDLVEAGEEVVITRRGKAVARLVPAVPAADRDQARAAAARIRRNRRLRLDDDAAPGLTFRTNAQRRRLP